jgi:hypothetical protein
MTFIHEFEKMLEENKITHSEPQLEKPVIETQERVETEKEVEIEVKLQSPLYLLTSKETIEFVIAITPTVLSIINYWYTSRKKKGEILIHTKEGTVKLSAESIRKFVFTEAKTRKSKKRKKAGRAKNKQIRNLKSAQQQKTNLG